MLTLLLANPQLPMYSDAFSQAFRPRWLQAGPSPQLVKISIADVISGLALMSMEQRFTAPTGDLPRTTPVLANLNADTGSELLTVKGEGKGG